MLPAYYNRCSPEQKNMVPLGTFNFGTVRLAPKRIALSDSVIHSMPGSVSHTESIFLRKFFRSVFWEGSRSFIK